MGGMRAGPDPGALANRSRRARKGEISTLQRPRWNLPSLPVLNTLVLIHLKGKEVTCRVHTMQAKGAKLMSGAGKTDADNAGQITHMENMIAAGAKTILITPSDSKAIVPSVKKARDAGVMVIALDSPTDPQEAADALFATDNFKAGVLIGQYAKAAMGGKPVKIATLDLFPGHPVGAQRHNGFLAGFGAVGIDA